jgi:hypothetical protein
LGDARRRRSDGWTSEEGDWRGSAGGIDTTGGDMRNATTAVTILPFSDVISVKTDLPFEIVLEGNDLNNVYLTEH